MVNIPFTSYQIAERSYVAYIKREIHNLVKPFFDEVRTGEIDIVISEICTNLINHVGSGELLYRITEEDENTVFEFIAIDNGKGIKDIAAASKDGFSSNSTLGHGLGAIKRLSNYSQIYSLPDWGTIIYAKFYKNISIKEKPEKYIIRCLNVAMPGEQVSGDGVAYKKAGNKLLVFVGDGLGHGNGAKEAADKAIGIFIKSNQADCAEIIREINTGVKKTRGLVATLSILDLQNKKWEICGVGNISTRVQKGLEFKNYHPNNGIVGLNIPGRLENSNDVMERFQHLISCSDGIKTRWDLVQYPGILKYDPMFIAAALYKDQGRKTDDMTALVIKIL